MATESRRSPPALIERLLAEPYRFSFFQAVRVLERHARERAVRRSQESTGGDELVEHEQAPLEDPVGADGSPTREAVRFRVALPLAFPATEIADLHAGDPRNASRADSLPWNMTVTFLGLIGPAGVLPAHYTELVQRRVQLRDSSLRGFLDALHHRTLSLFYRAWRKYRFPIEYEYDGQEGHFSAALSSLAGLGLKSLRSRQTFSDTTAAFFAGHLSQSHRSATALESLLREFFAVPIRVEQFLGQWLTIAEADRSRMPGKGDPRADSGRLGGGFALGSRVWDVQSKLRIHAGPMTYAEFTDLLAPKRPGQRRMRDLVRSYVGIEFDFDLVVLLKPHSAPPLALGGGSGGAARLGENTWMAAWAATAVAAPAVFKLE